MRSLLYSFALVLTACSISSTKSTPPPGWVMNPPGNQVTNCVPAGNEDELTLKDIATIKAKADYLAQKEVRIAQTSTATNTTRTNKTKANTNVELIEKTTQQVEGIINHQPEVKQAEIVEFNNQTYFCVRYGM